MPDTVGGLPLHPLIVHAVVVLIPLSALGAIAIALVPRWARPYAPLVTLGAIGSSVMAFLAKLAGDNLQASQHPPPALAQAIADHGRLGLFTLYASIPFALLAILSVVLVYRNASTTAQRISMALSAIAGIVALVLVVLAGEAGATAVWNPTSVA
jgi:uncharacterized membrane protein